MKEQPSNPCEKVSFILTYDQLEAAYNIYREQFISCDFIRRSMERLEERIGLCNLPYETLRDDPSLLHEAWLLLNNRFMKQFGMKKQMVISTPWKTLFFKYARR